MSNRKSAPVPTKILVANLTGSKDEQGNPIKARTSFSYQTLFDITGNPLQGNLVGNASNAVGVISVLDNDFQDVATIFLGTHLIISGIDWEIGVDAGTSATNLAAYIDSLLEFSASAVGTDITITGAKGYLSDQIVFKAEYIGSVVNFSFTPTTGYLGSGGPEFGPMGIGYE